MNPFTGTALYFTLWWLVLFAVLPFFGRPRTAPDEVSGWRGAPTRLRGGRIVLATTVLAGVVWLGIWLVVREGWIPLDSGWMAPKP
jgi:predicted secreted protein